MKLILYRWGSNTEHLLKKILLEIGQDVKEYNEKCEHYTKDINYAQGLISIIHEYNAEAVISYDYFPIISMVCNTVGIVYYSWVYDSPHYTLFASTSKYPCNRIGCFDRALTEKLNTLGVNTVRHLPLGVDWTGKGLGISGGYYDKKYACDISFVGSLYTGKFNYYDSLLDDKDLKQKADKIIKDQLFEYKKDYIKNFFISEFGTRTDTQIVDRARDLIYKNGLFPGNEYIEDVEYIFDSHFLDKKVTVEERKILLDKIVGMGHDFRLYTGSDLVDMPKLRRVSRGYVDYHVDMPRVFASSRININNTLRSIKTGIPLRALDIMGCGGFLLSNYQEELAEYFREGEELAMYYSLEDCLEKIDYYLTHEEERKRVARAGYEAVKERFEYRDQLRKLLSW